MNQIITLQLTLSVVLGKLSNDEVIKKYPFTISLDDLSDETLNNLKDTIKKLKEELKNKKEI